MINKTPATQIVVKSNPLVEARYRLSLQEMQILLWLLTKISPDDEDFYPHSLKITELSELIKVPVDSKYSQIRSVTKNLMRRVLEIYDPEKDEWLQVSWIHSARYQKNKGIVILKFSPDLKPHLLQLKSQFTKISISETLKLKSLFSIRVLELLLQYINIGERVITLREAKFFLGIQENQYTRYNDLKKDVFIRARNEITKKTMYNVDFSEIKESRKVVAIHWTITQKNNAHYTEPENTLSKEYRSNLALIEALIEYGFTKPTCIKMLRIHGEKVISDAVKAVDIQIKRKHAKNPKAMLRVAIKEHWKPDVFKSSS